MSDVGYFYAYELLGQHDPDIKEYVENLPIDIGSDHPMDNYKRDKAAVEIGKILDKLPVQNLSREAILELNNLVNMPEDEYTLNEIKRVSGNTGYDKKFIEEMQKRDKRDFREREFAIADTLLAVENETCEPPLILDYKDKKFVIDGRTRIYAALAANKDIKITVINNETFKGVL